VFEEARQDFARALRIGDAGRFSGAQLGSFRLGQVIGRGAMGEVYRGEHITTKEEAAIKVLLAGAAIQRSSLERFLREARIASAIDSPHVVKVLEIGADDTVIPYLAMELLRGIDLASLLRQRQRLPAPEVVEVVRQIGAGLTAASIAGIVHRDIKPQNLFWAEEPHTWKILDFGVSTIEGHTGTLTQGLVVGTPAYMAPEQASGGTVDPRADVYSLSAIAYRALTGRPPFWGQEVAPILYKVVNEMPPAPTSVASVDPDMDLALAVALAKRPEERFQNAHELADALDAASRGRLSPDVVARGQRVLAVTPWRPIAFTGVTRDLD
jgi:serine/threonine-protein kinase